MFGIQVPLVDHWLAIKNNTWCILHFMPISLPLNGPHTHTYTHKHDIASTHTWYPNLSRLSAAFIANNTFSAASLRKNLCSWILLCCSRYTSKHFRGGISNSGLQPFKHAIFTTNLPLSSKTFAHCSVLFFCWGFKESLSSDTAVSY